MAGSLNQNDDEMISGINVTPLVDVMLVLLVIFLITAPVIYQNAIKVELPQAKSGEATTQHSPLEFSVSKDGSIAWNNEVLTFDSLEAKLKTYTQKIEGQTAVINADTATPHGTVIRLMDALRKTGLTKFALSVDNRISN